MSLKLTLLSTFACLLFSTSAFATFTEKTITITAGEWPPFIGQELEDHGTVGKLIQDVFSELGYQVEFQFYPWARAYQKAQDGESDATAVWMFDEKRTEHFLFSDPVAQEQFVFFHHKDMLFEWETLNDIQGLTLGGGIGYSYGEEVNSLIDQELVTISRVKEPSQNFLRLQHKRIDLYPEEMHIGLYVLKQQPQEVQDSIGYNPQPFLSNDSFLMFSKNSPRGEELRTLFNQGLKQWKQNH